MQTVDRKFRRLLEITLASAGIVALLPSLSLAMNQKDYLEALKLVEAKVRRTHSVDTASALSSPMIKAYFGRYYRVGDSWDMAAWEIKNPLMNLAPITEGQPVKTGRGGVFRYEVKEVINGPTPKVVMSVKQISDSGLGPVDAKVEELTLTMSDQLVQTEKVYHFKGRPDPVKVSPDGLRSRITPLELFPLDVPEIETAIKNTPTSMPVLPTAVQGVAGRAGYQPLLSQCSWFEQDDFFGRPVQILWQYGNPWPSYMKTSTGVAILLRTNTSGRSS